MIHRYFSQFHQKWFQAIPDPSGDDDAIIRCSGCQHCYNSDGTTTSPDQNQRCEPFDKYRAKNFAECEDTDTETPYIWVEAEPDNPKETT